MNAAMQTYFTTSLIQKALLYNSLLGSLGKKKNILCFKIKSKCFKNVKIKTKNTEYSQNYTLSK